MKKAFTVRYNGIKVCFRYSTDFSTYMVKVADMEKAVGYGSYSTIAKYCRWDKLPDLIHVAVEDLDLLPGINTNVDLSHFSDWAQEVVNGNIQTDGIVDTVISESSEDDTLTTVAILADRVMARLRRIGKLGVSIQKDTKEMQDLILKASQQEPPERAADELPRQRSHKVRAKSGTPEWIDELPIGKYGIPTYSICADFADDWGVYPAIKELLAKGQSKSAFWQGLGLQASKASEARGIKVIQVKRRKKDQVFLEKAGYDYGRDTIGAYRADVLIDVFRERFGEPVHGSEWHYHLRDGKMPF